MAGTAVADHNGMFKVVYAEKLLDLVPDFAILQKRIDLTESAKTGKHYEQAVALTHEHGFTYNGDAGTINSALNGADSSKVEPAQVKGSELILRGQLSFLAVTRSAAAGEKAFKKETGWKVEEMNNSMRKRLEIAMLYGQSGIATVDVVTSGSGSGSFTVTEATWAGGIWAGGEGMRIDAFTSTTKNNGGGDLVVTGVNLDTRSVSVSCTGTLSDEIAAGDVIYFKGAYTGAAYNEMAGLQKIITNTGSLFNISASTYSMWKGSTASSIGTISFSKLQSAVSKAVNKGLLGKVLVLLSPKAWGVLNSDAAALRVFDASYSSAKLENGTESLMYHSLNGVMEIVSHPFVKDGEGFIIPEEHVMRVGSMDVSFSLPGAVDEYFFRVPGSNVVEVNCLADQAIFLEKPAHAVFLSGITY